MNWKEYEKGSEVGLNEGTCRNLLGNSEKTHKKRFETASLWAKNRTRYFTVTGLKCQSALLLGPARFVTTTW
jgi:hypothetical protein